MNRIKYDDIDSELYCCHLIPKLWGTSRISSFNLNFLLNATRHRWKACSWESSTLNFFYQRLVWLYIFGIQESCLNIFLCLSYDKKNKDHYLSWFFLFSSYLSKTVEGCVVLFIILISTSWVTQKENWLSISRIVIFFVIAITRTAIYSDGRMIRHSNNAERK